MRISDGSSDVCSSDLSEMELAFAGLHQLCAPMPDRLHSLPAAQRDGLSGALGLGSKRVPDGFLVALGTLGLLSEEIGSASFRESVCQYVYILVVAVL